MTLRSGTVVGKRRRGPDPGAAYLDGRLASSQDNLHRAGGERHGNRQVGRRVTNDRSPTWSWAIEDVNPEPAEDECYLYDDTSSYETLLSNAMLKYASHF